MVLQIHVDNTEDNLFSLGSYDCDEMISFGANIRSLGLSSSTLKNVRPIFVKTFLLSRAFSIDLQDNTIRRT